MRLARSIRCSAERHQKTVYGQSSKEIDLGGWCATTSNILFKELIRRGIRSRLVWNGDHCFLTYGRYLIDITATQFDPKLPKVVKRLRSHTTKALYWWEESNWKNTLAGCKRSRGWAVSYSSYEQFWQDKMRAHLRTLK